MIAISHKDLQKLAKKTAYHILGRAAQDPKGLGRYIGPCSESAALLILLYAAATGRTKDEALKALGAPALMCTGDFDDYEIAAVPVVEACAMGPAPEFREQECSGVFDGNQVVSDADPGL